MLPSSDYAKKQDNQRSNYNKMVLVTSDPKFERSFSYVLNQLKPYIELFFIQNHRHLLQYPTFMYSQSCSNNFVRVKCGFNVEVSNSNHRCDWD